MMATPPSAAVDTPMQSGQRLTLKIGSPSELSRSETKTTNVKEESSSPVRPSYSPVTPTLSHAPLASQHDTQTWIDEPDPLPVSLDDNHDAIALRATISLLQMQRQRALHDMKHLDRLKHDALVNPEGFVDDLQKGKLRTVKPDVIDADGENEDGKTQNGASSEFGPLPTAQNIARCPPIEWSKYHIAGESLDRLHELQREYPGLTENDLARGIKPQPHKVTAPYRPFTDQIEKKLGPVERDAKP